MRRFASISEPTKVKQLETLKEMNDKARDQLAHATDPSRIQQFTEENKRIVADAWRIIDGGISQVLTDRKRKHEQKAANNYALKKLLKAAQQKHALGQKLDEELAEEDSEMAALLTGDHDDTLDPKVQTTILIAALAPLFKIMVFVYFDLGFELLPARLLQLQTS